MIPADVRNLTFSQLRDHLAGPRETVWSWLRDHGPATTTAIAQGTGICLLTVRPRVTELCQLGFAECTGRLRREGVYQARTVADAQVAHDRNRERQTFLNL